MKDLRKMNRREFIAATTAGAVAAGMAGNNLIAADNHFHTIPPSPLPTRPFGKSGVDVPIMTFGCGSRWMEYSDDEAIEVINFAIDSGIRYLDSAHAYGRDGRSEKLIGQITPGRRKEVLIQTKLQNRNPDEWWRDLETSLTRMKIDYVDTLLIHSLGNEEDLAACEVKGGPIEQLYKAREQKLARWIGVSSHTNSVVMSKFLNRHKMDSIQMALNVATNNQRDFGFEENTLAVAVQQGLGIVAMKVMGQDEIANKYDEFSYDVCLRYVLSLPVSTATIGMPKRDHLEKNLALVKDFKPYSPEEMMDIKARAEGEIKTSFIDFMRNHEDVA